jgi:hypothetical protein
MENTVESRKVEIGEETLKHLNTARKWAMFLAIIGFIFLGIITVIGVIAGTFLTAFGSDKLNSILSGPLLIVPVLLIAVVYYFPGLFLFRFSKYSAHAVNTYDKNELHKAIKYLKSYFVYTGILIIIALSLYVATLIVTGSSMAFLKGV